MYVISSGINLLFLKSDGLAPHRWAHLHILFSFYKFIFLMHTGCGNLIEDSNTQPFNAKFCNLICISVRWKSLFLYIMQSPIRAWTIVISFRFWGVLRFYYLKQKKSLRSKLNEVTAYLLYLMLELGTGHRKGYTLHSEKSAICRNHTVCLES